MRRTRLTLPDAPSPLFSESLGSRLAGAYRAWFRLVAREADGVRPAACTPREGAMCCVVGATLQRIRSLEQSVGRPDADRIYAEALMDSGPGGEAPHG